MTTINTFLKELEQEAGTTRKFLKLVPDDMFDWKPHRKSMSMKQLAVHVAELNGWIPYALNTTELDFAANPYTPVDVKNTQELCEYFEKTWEDCRKQLAAATEEDMEKMWTLRSGEQIFTTNTKAEVTRMTLNQITHHRAQLGVYFRLLDIPVPGSYGPSADEMGAN